MELVARPGLSIQIHHWRDAKRNKHVVKKIIKLMKQKAQQPLRQDPTGLRACDQIVDYNHNDLLMNHARLSERCSRLSLQRSGETIRS